MSLKLDASKTITTGFRPSGPIQRGDMTYDKHIELAELRSGEKLRELPRRFSREKQTLRSQDIVGACVGFSVSNAVEADTVTVGDRVPLSPAYVYALCQKEDGYQQEGTFFPTARKVLMEYGICEESLYPFDVKNRKMMTDMKNLKFPPISSEVIRNGRKRKAKEMYRIPIKVEDIKRAIFEENSVVLGVTVTDTFLQDQNGVVGIMGGFIRGGHAIDCCSWDDDIELKYDYREVHGDGGQVKTYKGAFRFENHWTEEEDANFNPLVWWGDKGYGWIPYEVLTHKTDIGMTFVDEAWVIIMDNNGKPVDESYHENVSEDQFDGVPSGEQYPIKQKLDISFKVGSDVAIVNGKTIVMDCNSKLVNGRTLVPVRFIAEVFGASVGYISDVRTATITLKSSRRSIYIQLPIGSNMATINGTSVKMDVESITDSGRTLVPIRFIAEAFGATVGYVGSTNTATISITPEQLISAFDKWCK